MTEPDLQKLRVAVALADGWTPAPDYRTGDPRYWEINRWYAPQTKAIAPLPDYPSDRDAIIRAIVRRFVTDEEQGEFGVHLSRIIQPHGNLNFCAVASTAEQLCRAYVSAAGIPAT